MSAYATASAGVRRFEPSVTYLAEVLARAKVKPSVEETKRIVIDAAKGLNINYLSDTLPKTDFLRLCDTLKGHGGVIQFVATMAAAAAHIYKG